MKAFTPNVVITGFERPRRYVTVNNQTGVLGSTDRVQINSVPGTEALIEVREQTSGTLVTVPVGRTTV